ncbi:MAG: hypothetical protein RLP02_15940, partial [Coleofasciculus sp. C2-GNP5-27]
MRSIVWANATAPQLVNRDLEGNMPIVGKLAFFPWLTLPKPIRSGGFYFVPISTSDPRPVIGDEIADTAKQIFSRYVDIHGKPIETCT